MSVAATSAEDVRASRQRDGDTRTLWATTARAFVKDRAAVLGLVLFVALASLTVGAPLVAPYDPTAVHMRDRLQGPSSQYLLGTDELGRDLLSRVIYGARASFSVGIVAVAIALTCGVVLGMLAAYYGGHVDAAIMRVLDALLAFPGIILALAIVAVLGPSLVNVMVAVGIVTIPSYGRITRGAVLAVREKEYVEAGRALGASDIYLMFRVILPNCVSPLLVQASIGFANAILAETSLSFLGVGVQPPTPSWGAMLDTGRKYLAQTGWYSFSAGAAIFTAVLSLNLLGDGLRDALDPRLQRGRG
ncbi:MAG: ABC transporter permease [Chloroflexi bacterium]|nr:ABC transporter permease [Chloroflexota bacterium]